MKLQVLVIPCFNEESRLKREAIKNLLELAPDLELVLVDDGSTDNTFELLGAIAKTYARVEVLKLAINQGKGEAVRLGLNHALLKKPVWVGYADADFATPPSELARLLGLALKLQPEVLLGSRVLLLGSQIERHAWRHYLGRVFATLASLALRLPVYDTQCGAKFFKVSPAFISCIQNKFTSRWAFDVELLGRLTLGLPQRGRNSFVEIPLREWRDIKGSKLKASSMLIAGLDLIRIGSRLGRQRRLGFRSAAGETSPQPQLPPRPRH